MVNATRGPSPYNPVVPTEIVHEDDVKELFEHLTRSGEYVTDRKLVREGMYAEIAKVFAGRKIEDDQALKQEVNETLLRLTRSGKYDINPFNYEHREGLEKLIFKGLRDYMAELQTWETLAAEPTSSYFEAPELRHFHDQGSDNVVLYSFPDSDRLYAALRHNPVITSIPDEDLHIFAEVMSGEVAVCDPHRMMWELNFMINEANHLNLGNEELEALIKDIVEKGGETSTWPQYKPGMWLQDNPEETFPEVQEYLETSQKGEEVLKNIRKNQFDKTAAASAVTKMAAGIALEIAEYLQGKELQRMKQSPYKALYEDYLDQRESQVKDLKDQEIRFTYGSIEHIQQHITRRISPEGILEALLEARKMGVEFCRESDSIQEGLKVNAELGSMVKDAKVLNDRSAQRDHKDWKHRVRKQQKLSSKLNLTKTLLGIAEVVVGGAACLVPGGQGAGMALAVAGVKTLSTGAQLGQQRVDKKTARLNARYQGKVRDSEERSDSLQRSSFHIQEQGFGLQQLLLNSHRNLVAFGSDVFDAVTYQGKLAESVQIQERKLAETTAKLATAQQVFDSHTGCVSMDRARLELLKNPSGPNPHGFVFKKRKKKVTVDGQSETQLNNFIMKNETVAASAGVEVEGLKKEKEKRELLLKETKEEEAHAKNVQPLKIGQEAMYARAGLKALTAPEQERYDRRKALASSVREAHSLVESTNQLYSEAATVAHQYAWFLGNATGSTVPLQLASIAHDAVAIRNSSQAWSEIAKQVNTYRKAYASGEYGKTLEALRETVPGESSKLGMLVLSGLQDLLPYMRLAFTMGSLFYRINQEPAKAPSKSDRSVLLESLDESVKFLQGFIQFQMGALGDKLDVQHRELCDYILRANMDILQAIDIAQEKVLGRIDDVAYGQHLLRLEEKIKKIKHQGKLKLAIENELSPSNTGIVPGLDMSHESSIAYPVINPLLAYRNPEHFTGLLFAPFNLHQGVPNIKLLETLVDLALASSDSESITKLHASYIAAQKAFGSLDKVIGEVVSIQQRVVEQVGKNREVQKRLQNAYLQRERAEAIQQGLPLLEKLQRGGYVGYDKFFVWNELFSRNLNDVVPPYDGFKLKNRSEFGEGAIGKIATVAFWAFSVVMTTAITHTVFVSNPRAGIAAGASFASLHSGQLIRAKNEGIHRLVPVDVWDSQHRNDNWLRSKIATPIAKFFQDQPKEFDPNPSAYVQRQRIFVDLTSRKLVASSGSSAIPMAELAVHYKESNDYRIDDAYFRLNIDPKSPIQADQLASISPPGIGRGAYNQKVEALLQGYKAYLQGNESSLEKEFQGSPLIASVNPQMLPLVFPSQLVEELQKNLQTEISLMEGTGMGTLVPKYDFSLKGKEYVLSLSFHCIEPGRSSEFCSFDLYKFAPVVVNAFQKDLQGKKPSAPNEFLLQAMYGSFFELGLPDEQSLEFAGIPAPHEAEFEGLFERWSSDVAVLQTHIGSGYLSTLKRCYQANKSIQHDLEAYKTAYMSLFGLTKLISTIPNKEFGDQMNEFGLMHPDLFKRFVHEHAATNPSKQQIQEFAQRILDNPSPQMERLQEKVKRLTA